MSTRAALSLIWIEERRFMGWDRDRERSLTHCGPGKNRLGEISFIYYQSDQSKIMRNKIKTLKTPFSQPLPFFLGLTISWHQLIQGNGHCGKSSHVAETLSLSGGEFSSLILCTVPPTGDSSPWTSPVWVLPLAAVLHKLLQGGALPQGAILEAQPTPGWDPHEVKSSASKIDAV